ncbi:MAG: PaaI family thioesterase [Desulfobacterales bacterium]|nr:PaaI family thioesterase [Desulfobacterales bacterium]
MTEAAQGHKARKRTVTWQDPAIAANSVRTMSGLEFVFAIQNGTLPQPPIARLLGYRIAHVEKGQAVFELVPEEFLYNPIGSVHGGVACTLLDSAMSCAVHTLLPQGAGYTTIEVKVNFIRPVTGQTRIVRSEAHAVHIGRRLATAEGRLIDPDGKLFAHGTATFMVLGPGQPDSKEDSGRKKKGTGVAR